MVYGGGLMNSFSDIPNISNVQLYKSWTEDKMELVRTYDENHNEVFFSRTHSFLHNPNESNPQWIWTDHEFIADPATAIKIEEVSAFLMLNEEGVTQPISEEEEKAADEPDVRDFFISEEEIPADLMTETENEVQDLDAFQWYDDEENASEGFDVEGFFTSDDNPAFEETAPTDLSAGVDVEVSESSYDESTGCQFNDEDDSSVETDIHEFSNFEENSVSEEGVLIEIVEDAGVSLDEQNVCQIETEDTVFIEGDIQDFSSIEEQLAVEMHDDVAIEDETLFQMECGVEEEEIGDDAENRAENEGILIQNNEIAIAGFNLDEISIDTVSDNDEELAIADEIVENEDNILEIEEDEEEDYDDSEDDEEFTVQSNDETMDYEGVNESEEEEGEEDFSNPDSGNDSQDSHQKHSWEYISEDEGVRVKHLNHLMGRVWEKIGNQAHHFRIFEFSVT